MNAPSIHAINRHSPPHEDDVERALLSRALLAGGRGGVLGLAEPSDFYQPDHINAWAAMRAMVARGELLDELTLAKELDGDLEDPQLWVAELSCAAPTPANADYYAKRVRGLRGRRDALYALARSWEELNKPGVSTEVSLTSLQSSLGRISTELADDQPTPGPQAGGLPRFPLYLLPPTFQRIFQAYADRTTAAVELAVAPGLGVLSAALGPGWRVGPRTLTKPAANWFALVAAAGTGKTPTARPLLEPLEEADVRLREEWELAKGDHERAVAYMNRKEPRPQPPARRRLLLSDTTVEALAKELAVAEGNGMLLHADELGSLLSNMDGHRGRGRKGRSDFLSLWSGVPIRTTRKTSDPIEVDRPFLAVVSGIQPSVLRSLELADGDGLCARFLWVHAPSQVGGLGHPVDEQVKRKWAEAVELALAFGGGPDQHLSPAGRELFDEFTFETRATAAAQDEAGAGLASAVWGKGADQAARLLALLHGMDEIEEAMHYGEPLRPREVPAETVARALDLARWFIRHSLHSARLVVARSEAETQSEANEEDLEVAAGLAKIVGPGEERTEPAGVWAGELLAAGVRVRGKGTRGKATTVAGALKRIEGNPVLAIETKQAKRGEQRGWTVRHLAADTCDTEPTGGDDPGTRMIEPPPPPSTPPTPAWRPGPDGTSLDTSDTSPPLVSRPAGRIGMGVPTPVTPSTPPRGGAA